MQCNHYYPWVQELQEAMDNGPVLILIDFSALNSFLLGISDEHHRVKSMPTL